MKRCFTSLAAITLIAPLVTATPQQLSTYRVIEEDVRIRPPLVPCAVPGVAARIARSVRTPMGIEAWPERCGVGTITPGDAASDVVLTGLSVRDALDTLVQLDPRYSWTETEGVFVIRPLLASSDPSHFLHQNISAFQVDDQRLFGALEAIERELSPLPLTGADGYASRTPEGDRRFSLHLSATSILEALNAVLRAHGSMVWMVTYCQPAARYEYATVSLSTFDGSGLGIHAATWRDDGTTFDACRLPR